jgi:hypothetical protein
MGAANIIHKFPDVQIVHEHQSISDLNAPCLVRRASLCEAGYHRTLPSGNYHHHTTL